MIRTQCILPCLLISLFTGSVRAGDEPFSLRYSLEGGMQPYGARKSQVIVNTNGTVTIELTRRAGEFPWRDSFQLYPEEIRRLTNTIRKARFFTLEANPRDHAASDAGWTQLTIHMDGVERTMKFGYVTSLSPLKIEFNRLTRHAIVRGRLNEGFADAAMRACSNPSDPKLFSPRRLIPPLVDFIAGEPDRKQTQWALWALGGITSADEWLRILTDQIDKTDTDHPPLIMEILGSRWFNDHIPRSHVEAELPLLIKLLDRYAGEKPVADEKTDSVMSSVCSLLQMKGDETALPVLINVSRIQPSHTETAFWARRAIDSIERRAKQRVESGEQQQEPPTTDLSGAPENDN